MKYLTYGGNSKVYFGTWNLLLNVPKQLSLLLNVPKQLSVNIALKAIEDFDDINDHILNEVRKKNQKNLYLFLKLIFWFNYLDFLMSFNFSVKSIKYAINDWVDQSNNSKRKIS